MANQKDLLSVKLNPDIANRFEKVKRWYGLENDTDVVRALICDKYRELFPKEK